MALNWHLLAMRRFLCKNAACTKVTFAGQTDSLSLEGPQPLSVRPGPSA